MEKKDIVDSLQEVMVDPSHGCNLGTTFVEGPIQTVNTSGYYFWWFCLGWCVSAHRLYMGEWIVPILVTAGSIAFVSFFVVWAAVLLFSISDTAVLLPLTCIVLFSAIEGLWMLDGMRGCTLVELYNSNVNMAEMSEAEQEKYVKVRKNLEEAAEDISRRHKHQHYKE